MPHQHLHDNQRFSWCFRLPKGRETERTVTNSNSLQYLGTLRFGGAALCNRSIRSHQTQRTIVLRASQPASETSIPLSPEGSFAISPCRAVAAASVPHHRRHHRLGDETTLPPWRPSRPWTATCASCDSTNTRPRQLTKYAHGSRASWVKGCQAAISLKASKMALCCAGRSYGFRRIRVLLTKYRCH